LSSDKKTVWLQAVVLILLAGLGYVMVAAYARNYPHADALPDDAAATTQPAPNGPPGAPTRADVARLHDALRKQFGVNGRGVPRVAHLDYDGWPNRLHVVFALDHAPITMTQAQAMELRPLRDVLEAVHASGLQWGWVLVTGTAPIEGRDRRVTESTALRAQFSREKLDRIDWSRLTAAELEAMADQFAVDPSLADVRGPSVATTKPAPATRPATKPSEALADPSEDAPPVEAPAEQLPAEDAPADEGPAGDGSVVEEIEIVDPDAL
jgi:hypothetical protein